MDYKPLRSLFYVDKEQYEEEYGKRVNSEGVYRFPIEIKSNAAFLVATLEIGTLIEEIGRYSMEANRSYDNLPGVAQNYYLQKCLIDEIQTTNEIEGIYSTKKEIRDTIGSLDRDDRRKRFNGMIKKYIRLLDREDDDAVIRSSADIRKLYDEIVADEIPADKQPDGVIFRKGTVHVVSKTQQKRHEGVNPEEKIIDYTEKSLGILAAKELPELVKIAAFHYFFGYIHPFYDGNGRMNRYISSLLLHQRFASLIAFDLSYVIKEHKERYYKAFRICNDARNMGDITPFVITFLEFIREAAKYLCRSLGEGDKRLGKYCERIESEGKLKKSGKTDKKNEKMLFLFVQNALFAAQPFTIEELTENMECGKSSTLDTLDRLAKSGAPIVESKDGRKKTYTLDLERFDDYLDKKEGR